MARADADTGESTEYTDAEAARVADAVENALADYADLDEIDWSDLADDDGWPDAAPPAPTRMVITATIEWSGSYNRRPHRTVTFTGLDAGYVARVSTAMARVAQLKRAAEPYRTYTARSWRAQWRKVTSVRGGAAALAAAGLDATGDTRRAWSRGKREPNAANQERIAQAYRWLAEQPIRRSASELPRAQRALSQALTDMVAENQGGDQVRFFNITHLEFGQ